MVNRKILTFPQTINIHCHHCGCRTHIRYTNQVCYEHIPLPGFGTQVLFYAACSTCGQLVELTDGSGKVGIPQEQDKVRQLLRPYFEQDLFLAKRQFAGHNLVQGDRKKARFRPSIELTCSSCHTVISVTQTTDIFYQTNSGGEMGTIITFMTTCPVCRVPTTVSGHYKILEKLQREGYFQHRFS